MNNDTFWLMNDWRCHCDDQPAAITADECLEMVQGVRTAGKGFLRFGRNDK